MAKNSSNLGWKEIKTDSDLPKDYGLYWVTVVSPFGGHYVYVAGYDEHSGWRIDGYKATLKNVIAYRKYTVPKPFSVIL